MLDPDRGVERDELRQLPGADVGSPDHQNRALGPGPQDATSLKSICDSRRARKLGEVSAMAHGRNARHRLDQRRGRAELKGRKQADIDHTDGADQEVIEHPLTPALRRVVAPEIHQTAPQGVLALLEGEPHQRGTNGAPGRAADADDLELVLDLRLAQRLQRTGRKRGLASPALARDRDFNSARHGPPCSVRCHAPLAGGPLGPGHRRSLAATAHIRRSQTQCQVQPRPRVLRSRRQSRPSQYRSNSDDASARILREGLPRHRYAEGYPASRN